MSETSEKVVREKTPAEQMRDQLKSLVGLREGMDKMMEGLAGMTVIIEQTGQTLLKRLDAPIAPELEGTVKEILGLVRAGPAKKKQRWYQDVRTPVGILALALAIVAGRPYLAGRRTDVFAALNPVIVQAYPSLSPAVKAKLDTVYTQHGYLSPAKQMETTR